MSEKTRIKSLFRAIVAITLDGRIAMAHEPGSTWTSREDKHHLKRLLDSGDGIVVGAGTYRTAPHFLQKYDCIVLTHSVDGVVHEDGVTYINADKVDMVAHVTNVCQWRTVNVLGGTMVYSWFIQHDLLDEIIVTVEPLVFGRGAPFVDADLPQLRRFHLYRVDRLNKQGSVALYYKK